MTVVVGTAGHIDHGKTALLRALTGIDADRLPEERRRGLTIDVGYAHLALPDGSQLDFVDVPGHDRLVGNMLVGAGEIEAVLLVVAADDGPRAQTLEHLALIDALGIAQGVVALTKVDVVDRARMAAAGAEIRALLAGTTLDNAPIVPVSSIDRRGLDQLTDSLVELRDRVLAERGARDAAEDRSVRLAIDRAFVIKGRGPVVTGSLRGGRLGRGDQLRLVPGEQIVRVRELHVHGGPVESISGGGRVALNLAGIEADGLQRGQVLTTDGRVVASSSLIAVVHSRLALARTVDGSSWPPVPGSTFRLHLGTDQVGVRLGRGKRDWQLLPDGRLVVRLRLARPMAVSDGDRFVLRGSIAGRLPIGGVILDSSAPVGPSRRRVDPDRLAALALDDPADHWRAIVAIHGIVDPDRLAGAATADPSFLGPGVLEIEGRLIDSAIVDGLQAEALAAVANPGSAGNQADRQGRPLAEVRTILVRSLRRVATVERTGAGPIVDTVLVRLVASGRLARTADRIHRPGLVVGPSAAVLAAMDRLERLLTAVAPPSLAAAAGQAGCPVEGIRLLESSGRIVRLEADLAYAAPTYAELARTAVRMAEAGPLSPAALRDATGTSRKYVMAILEDLDRRGILRRTPDGHLPGSRSLVSGLDRPDG